MATSRINTHDIRSSTFDAPKARRRFLAATFLLLAFALSHAMAAPPEGKGPKGKPGKKAHGESSLSTGHHSGSSVSGSLRRAGITADIARQIAVQHRATGYDSLPPGIRKNLARGKPLPPGIRKRAVPQDVRDRLPRYSGYEWEAVGSDLVLKQIAGGLIADVLVGVFN